MDAVILDVIQASTTIFSACNTCRAPRWGRRKGKRARHRRGRAIREKKNPNDEHLIQTFTMTHFDEKRAFIFGFVIVVRAHFNWKTHESNKSIGGIS